MRSFQGKRELILLLIAIIILIFFFMLPPSIQLTTSALRLCGIFISSIFLWMTVGISWPALFCLLALSLLPELPMDDLIKSAIGNPAISFLIFTFCCSYAINETPFTRRCAIWFITRPLVKNKPWLFISLYFLSLLLVGSCMSTTVIVLIYLNINEEIFKVLNLQKGDTLAAMITMGLVITAGISGAMTPIAHVFPLVSINFYTSLTGTSISYLSYIIAGVPTALVAVSCMLLIFRFVLKPNVEPLAHIDLGVLTNSLKPADRREKLAVFVFALVVLLWVVPDLIKYLFLPIVDWIAHYGTVMPPLLGTVLFCIIQVDGKPLLKLEDGAKNIPWTSLFMAAAALALGSAITNKDIGLSTFIESLLVPLSSFSSEFIIVFLLVLITAFMTNICSNMVTVTIISSFALPLAIAMNGVLHVGALAVIIGMVSAYAFATPPAMTTVVLGTGTGWINNKQMSKYGFLVLIPSILAIAFIAYPIAKSFI